jgi:hypothetical protein
VTTAAEVYELARARYGQVGAVELGTVYAGLPDADPQVLQRVASAPVGGVAARRLLVDTVERVDSAPRDLLRINVYDPHCGVGAFLVNAAWQLAHAYASGMVGEARAADELAAYVLPQVILNCVYGMDTDPLAVELARLALSLATDGEVTPRALEEQIVCGDPATGVPRPVKQECGNTLDLARRIRQVQ